MELVLLQDVVSSYASNWARIALTAGVKDIHIGDRFREQGFGPGAEEMEVAGIDLSPVGGASRIFFNRCANATQPMTHRLGAVFELVSTKSLVVDLAYQPLRETVNVAVEPEVFDDKMHDALKVAVATMERPGNDATGESAAPPPPLVPLKRGRGRPPGSKNKPKDDVELPVGFA